MKKLATLLAGMFLLVGFLWARPVAAGGWAVLTLEEMPTEVVAERPLTVRFALRQHGQHLLAGVDTTVTAVHIETGEQVRVEAVDAEEEGYYEATLTFPAAGTWAWTVHSFGEFKMPPLTVVAAPGVSSESRTAVSWPLWGGAVALVAALGLGVGYRRSRRRWQLAGAGLALLLAAGTLWWQWQGPRLLTAQAENTAAAVNSAVPSGQWGEALFVAKGCVQCHQNGNVTLVSSQSFSIGPDLTHYKGNADFLRVWLADPTAVKPETLMPDLKLSEPEIESLVGFLSEDG